MAAHGTLSTAHLDFYGLSMAGLHRALWGQGERERVARRSEAGGDAVAVQSAIRNPQSEVAFFFHQHSTNIDHSNSV